MIRFFSLAAILIAANAGARGIDELNAQRRNFGLPPCVEDPQLTAFAQEKCEWQAEHGVNLRNGYNGHEGRQNPWGFVEGTGCVTADWGWCTCAMRSLGSHRVGCGVCHGPDGNRYMCLIVAARSINESNVQRPVINTSHMTPNAPRMSRCGRCVIPREPRNRWFTPRKY